jgi:hypothetical protein
LSGVHIIEGLHIKLAAGDALIKFHRLASVVPKAEVWVQSALHISSWVGLYDLEKVYDHLSA